MYESPTFRSMKRSPLHLGQDLSHIMAGSSSVINSIRVARTEGPFCKKCAMLGGVRFRLVETLRLVLT